MKLRWGALVGATVAALSVMTSVPAHALSTDPVTGLTVSAVQTPGAHDRWTVTASWDQNDASRYTVEISDSEVGGVTFTAKDVGHAPATLTTDALLGDEDYWVRVRPSGGTAAPASFHTPALDTTAPDATYQLDRTSGYIGSVLAFEPSDLADEPTADFVITQTASDGAASRTVVAGDGTAARSWESGTTFPLHYAKPGVYTPHVMLSDEFANTRDIALPTVRVLADTTGPAIHITKPAKPGRVASWRRIRGTVSDVGTGVVMVGVFVMEKRGDIWWSYDFRKRTWLEGTSSRMSTEKKSKARPAFMPPPRSGSWRTPVIKGLTAGTLFVEAAAFDGELNVNGRTLTRRIR